MAKKISENDIQNMSQDWASDPSNGLPYSGAAVQKFIKDTFKSKLGFLYYDPTSNRYLAFADEVSKNEYIENPTKTELVLGAFDAPFNYEASITLASPSYNAVFLGATGNYLEFTFDIKNKSGQSTGENVNVTYTFIRNASKKVVSEARKYGESVRFNIDDYLLEGTNTIIVAVTGQTSLASTTVALTYQVVNLSFTDSVDIAQVYDVTEGAKTVEVFFSVSGYGTKMVEWFLDGSQLPFEKSVDEVVDVSSDRTKYITLKDLATGVHTLQYRAYTLVNGEKFYTDTLYREVMVVNGNSNANMVSVATSLPHSHGIVSSNNPLTLYGAEQYIPYALRFATRKSGEVSVSLAGEVLTTLSSSAGIETEYTFTTAKSGTLSLVLSAVGAERNIPLQVSSTSLKLEEITTGLSFDFTAKGRSNYAVDKDVWSYKGYKGTFTGFKWNAASGWVDNSLLLDKDSVFSVNFAPLATDATATGKTFEFEFSTRNVEDDNAVICDLTSGGTGILITASEARITSSAGEVLSTRFKAGEVNRIAFVINRKTSVTYKGLVFVYVNGIISGAVNYGSADNFVSSAMISFRGSEKAQVQLRAMRFYDNALSADNVLNNYTLYRDTMTEMMEVYYRNDIYEGSSNNFSPSVMLHRLPVMVITGDIPTLEAATSTSTQILVDIEYTNEQDPSKNFRMSNAALRIQGTSSLAYPRKNFRFYTKKEESTLVYDSNGQIIPSKLYSFKDKAQPVDCWCLKADYAESSGTHNTAIARLWNSAMFGAVIQHTNVLGVETNGYVLRTEAQNKALGAGYQYDVRTTIDGFPIVLFYKRKASDTELVFLGKYNFNNDKSTPSVFGFEGIPNFNNTRMQCWETRDNGHPLGLFTDISNFDRDWSEAYESRYPDTKSPNTADLKAFSTWINGVSQSNFAREKWSHMDVYKVAAYYVYLMRFGAVDQTVKNGFLTSEDGVHFYYINYDNDTINGLINTGELRLEPDINRQTIGSDGEYVYAGHESVLWNRCEADAEFMDIVSIVDNALYSAGLRYDEVLAEFNEKQADKWVERVYNQDAEYKYLLPYVNSATNNLFMLQGSRSSHRSWWLSKRFSLYDSIFVSGAYRDRNISFKCLNNTAPGQRFSIVAGTDMIYGYGVNNGIRETGIELGVGQSYTFVTTDTLNLGDVVKVFGAADLSELDLSPLSARLAVLDCSASSDSTLGSKLKRLILGNSSSVNTELGSVSGIKVLTQLQEIDVRGFQNIKSLDLTAQTNIKKVVATGSGVASVDFAKGAPVEYLALPSSIMALNFNQLPYLTHTGLNLEGGYANIVNISITGCPMLSQDFSLVHQWVSEKTTADAYASITMDNVNWRNVDVNNFISFSQRVKNGMKADLRGKVVLSSITPEQVEILMDVWGDNCFEKDSDLFISAPDTVYILGGDSVTEGDGLQLKSFVISEYQGSVTWSVVGSGASVDQNGYLTTIETGSERTVTVQVTHTPTMGSIVTVNKTISVSKAIRPTSASINGESVINEDSTYTLSISPANINKKYTVSWTLEGDAFTNGSVAIKSSYETTCVVGLLKDTSYGNLTIKATVTSDDGSSVVATKSVLVGTTLTINIDSNQADKSDIQSAYAFVSCGSINYQLSSGQTVSLPVGQTVVVNYTHVDEYSTPKGEVYITTKENKVISALYQTEILTVNVTSDIQLPTGFTITVGGIGSQTTESNTYKIPFGTSYTVSATTVNGYKTPKPQSFTANVDRRVVVMEYLEDLDPVDLSRVDIYGNPISQTTANCYVIKRRGTYKFPLVFGNAITNGIDNKASYTKNDGSNSSDFVDSYNNVISSPYIENVSGTANDAILSVADTPDIFNNISIIDEDKQCRYVQFDVTKVSDTGANGIISIRDTASNVLWSWLIWVWPYDLTPVEITNATGVKYNIFPVNLATKLDAADDINRSTGWKNWHYQYGRPTPAICSSSFDSDTEHPNYGTMEVKISSPASDIYQGIRNPSTIFKEDYKNEYSWASKKYDKMMNLWDASSVNVGASDNATVKTIYDPCPIGFKVPNANVFNSFKDDTSIGTKNQGRRFKRYENDTVGVYFPYTGMRRGYDGVLYTIGDQYYIYTASFYNYVKSYRFYAIQYGVYLNYSNTGSGYSIRPVEE